MEKKMVTDIAHDMGLPKTKPWLGLDWFDRAILVIVAAILIYQVILPPIVGLADNGDYNKVMWPAGLAARSELYISYIASKFKFIEPGQLDPGLKSSERLIARVARTVGLYVTKDGLFDIRVLSSIHSLLLLIGLALMLSAARGLRTPSRRMLALLLAFIFTDVGYVALFNSFYTQTASFLFLILAAGSAALIVYQGGGSHWSRFGFFIAAALFVTSKPQEAPQALLLALFLFQASRVSAKRYVKLQGLGLAIGLVIVGGDYYLLTPKYLSTWAIYDVVFEELLPSSPDPQGDLKSLGLSSELAKYSGTSAFTPNTAINQPWIQQAFYDKISYRKVLQFYATHPKRLWQLAKKISLVAFTLKTIYGNFEESSGLPPSAHSTGFKLWSDLKQRALPGSPWVLLVIFGGNVLTVTVLRFRYAAYPSRRLGLEAIGISNLMALGAFLICVLGDTQDMVRHLYAFNAMTDLCLIISLVSLVEITAATAAKHSFKLWPRLVSMRGNLEEKILAPAPADPLSLSQGSNETQP